MLWELHIYCFLLLYYINGYIRRSFYFTSKLNKQIIFFIYIYNCPRRNNSLTGQRLQNLCLSTIQLVQIKLTCDNKFPLTRSFV